MKKRQILSLFIVFVSVLLIISGCANSKKDTSDERIPVSGILDDISSENSSSASDTTESSSENTQYSSDSNNSSQGTSSTPTSSSSSPSSNTTSNGNTSLTESSKFVMPKMYTDSCVIQQNSTINIWGKFEGSEKLTLIFNGKEYYTQCNNGEFSFKVNTPAASKKAYEIVIHNGKYKKTIRNVAVGEVFLMGGQSNMVFFNVELSTQPPEATDGGNQWIRFTNTQPIGKRTETPQEYQGTWYVTSNGTFPGMSAFCSWFSRKMYKELNVPIGVVTCAMSDSSLAAWLTETDAAKLNNENTSISTPYYQHTPGQLYNTILYSFLKYTFHGAVWYQGESSTAATYEKNLETFIKCWRNYLNAPNLPFVIVQLPGYEINQDWPATREAQKNVCNKLENCAYTVNIDLGEKGNIHPQDKKPAAERAASAMLNLVFGKNEPKPALFKSATKQGSNIVLKFNNASNMRLANSSVTGIEISTNGQNWTPVSSNQITVNGDTVTISNVSSATQIRYAWTSWPSVSLFNGNGLPAEPFRAIL